MEGFGISLRREHNLNQSQNSEGGTLDKNNTQKSKLEYKWFGRDQAARSLKKSQIYKT